MLGDLKIREPSPEHWALFVDDPVGFVYEIIGAKPQQWQAEAMRRVADPSNQLIAIKACHGPGKTTVAAWMILWFMATRPFARVPCTAPTEAQLNDRLWPELHKWYRTSRGELWKWFTFEKTKYFLTDPEYRDEWFAVATVARVMKASAFGDEAPGLQGYHADHVLVIIDEASGVDNAVYSVLEGALSSGRETKLCAFGNPNIPRGWFFDAWGDKKNFWNTMTISYKDSPNVNNKWAEGMIDRHGIGHPWVRVRVLGEFPDTLENGLFGFEMMERVVDLKIRNNTTPVCVGVDVARYGGDRSVLALTSGGKLKKIKAYTGLSTDELALESEAFAERYGASIIVVDCDGIGAGVGDTLQMLSRGCDYSVVRWQGSFAANKGDRFANSKTELLWKFRDAIGDGDISLIDSDKLIRQASGIMYGFTEDGRIKVEGKKKLTKILGESPDELDAASYAFAPFLYGTDGLPSDVALTADDVVL